MHYYFAPMEGLTDSTQRKIHHRYFPGVDRYYMPFLSPTMHRTLTHREERELPLADSVSFTAIPQILTKIPEDFLWAAQVCADRGYREVNLNIGCPSGTVVSKGKGAGMLADPAALDRFFDSIFTSSPVPISVKTRLGISDPGEFPTLVEIFNRYPICELTLHPRVRKAFYNGDVHMDSFRYLVQNSKNPVDMFFCPIERTGRGNGYQSYFLVPCRDRSIDVKEKYIKLTRVFELEDGFGIYRNRRR